MLKACKVVSNGPDISVQKSHGFHLSLDMNTETYEFEE